MLPFVENQHQNVSAWPHIFEQKGWMEVSNGSEVRCRFPGGSVTVNRNLFLHGDFPAKLSFKIYDGMVSFLTTLDEIVLK